MQVVEDDDERRVARKVAQERGDGVVQPEQRLRRLERRRRRQVRQAVAQLGQDLGHGGKAGR